MTANPVLTGVDLFHYNADTQLRTRGSLAGLRIVRHGEPVPFLSIALADSSILHREVVRPIMYDISRIMPVGFVGLGGHLRKCHHKVPIRIARETFARIKFEWRKTSNYEI